MSATGVRTSEQLGPLAQYTLENKVEIWKIKATGSADRDFLIIYSGHG